ncbi:MAG: M23 family metallopeptidase [Candidatus Devosia phytovorans]|uniref:M23 family metallopeptidase n=1 Tax=Candidatus Devosia phytovorans TaxID=3121372 RepID=A0AAJ5VWB6_9HYPH|nr:M23 family metallopeptidase [Devosia sp.]WEK06118.1 MAG: M23 family metallopeptidase [Devosia sp.]
MGKQAGFGRSDAGQKAPHIRRGIHPAVFYGMFTVLLTGNALLGTALLLSSDISKLLGGQNEQIVDAYEDRIAQLRVEVDRLHSRSYAQAGDMNLQLQELAQQQEVLLEQHQLVRILVDKADQLGIEAATLTPGTGDPSDMAELAPMTVTGNPDVDATAAAVSQMMDETQSAMTSIARTATERTDSIVSELDGLGIAVDLPESLDGVGGPLLPAEGDMDASPMVEDANAVMAALVRYKAARDNLDAAPIHMPISGNYRSSSGFGNRRDPFTGGRAFHSGMDFAAASGTVVTSAGKGTVTFVGQKSGYGNVVEVTHASGLLTRYGHLSSFLSEEGQAVNTGTPIAKVGSTGRSTGPHLHFEVRKADTAINPKAFIDAGKRLLDILG